MLVHVETKEVQDEGLITLIGKPITLFCLNYIYHGKLVGVNNTCVKISGAKIVYDTGSFANKEWKDSQALPSENTMWYVSTSSIESFGER